jgi:two-component system NtrC family response regulator
MPKVLVIDDDPAINSLFSHIVSKLGHQPAGALTLRQGLDRVRAEDYDVVILDVNLPDGNGLAALSEIQKCPSIPEVIIITGFGDPDAAELAINSGAWDYILKPSSTEEITLTLNRALTYRKEKRTASVPRLLKRDDIIGNSFKLNQVLERVAQAAASKANVLIRGETGTGKELLARAIHENSDRAKHRFVVVDCASLPEPLVESTLFGHAKGAYTGADRERDGLIKQADGGTLFLDEIGELPLCSQKAFLRVIQEQCFRPVRGHEEIKVDFRLIAATNRNLDEMADAGIFRADLLYRLKSFGIETPPLRQRKRDIRALAIHYVNKLCDIYHSESKGFSADFFDILSRYDWPGNVRELFNALEEALSVAGPEPMLNPHYLPTYIRAAVARSCVKASAPRTLEVKADLEPDSLTRHNFLNIQVFRDKMERQYLEKLTLLTNGNRKEACRISGLSRTRLFELLRKHDLSSCLRKNADLVA